MLPAVALLTTFVLAQLHDSNFRQATQMSSISEFFFGAVVAKTLMSGFR
jgi:hypothetical protein